MRLFICCALFLICVALMPSAEGDRKYNKVDERDKREARERYGRRNDDDYVPKRRYKRSDSDEDLSVSRSDILRRERRREDEPRTKTYKEKIVRRRLEDTDEDYTDEDLSDVCVNKRGGRCDSDDLTDETNEDYTDEESDDRQGKRRVIYVKKFPHEKRKKKFDRETGTILKIHKKAGAFGRSDDDDTTSEEIGGPKRRRYVYDDDDE